MADADLKDEKDQKEETVKLELTPRNRRILAGILVVVAFFAFLAALGLFSSQTPPKQASEEPAVGVMDMQQLFKAHKDYGRLQQLRQDAKVLEADLQAGHMVLKPKAPEPDKQLFDDASHQKQNLEAITRHSQGMEKLKAEAKAIQARLQPGFEAEKRNIDNSYRTRILNIRLKQDNADLLQLDDTARAKLASDLKALQLERGDKQRQLREDQERRLKEQIQQETGEEQKQLEQEVAALRQNIANEEQQRLQQVQQRNAQKLEQALAPLDLKLDDARKKAALAAKKQEIIALQKKMFDDIAGRASKLAIIHHLTLILADPADNLLGMEYEKFHLGAWAELRTPVLGIATIDLTEEMLQEMKTIQ